MMNTIENIWYLPAENTWKDFQVMAMKDIGTLFVYPNGLEFKGKDTDLAIKQALSVSYGKQGRDFINNWVKLEYYDNNNEIQQAYFADGNNRGWAGIFGGTKKIFNLLKTIYNL
jgi:hypothetical protein